MTKNEKRDIERAFQEQRLVLSRLEDVQRRKPRIKNDADFADAAAWGARVYALLFKHVTYAADLKAQIIERDTYTFNALEVSDIIAETLTEGQRR